MKINFYLRGLGIGMVVASLIMGITNKPEELSEEQIKYRASLLGMIDESDLLLSEIENVKKDEKRTISVSLPDLRIPQVSENSPLVGDVSQNEAAESSKENPSENPSENPCENPSDNPSENPSEKSASASSSVTKSAITEQIRTGNQADESEDGQAPSNRKNKTEKSSSIKEDKTSSSEIKDKKEDKTSSSEIKDKKEDKTSSSEIKDKKEDQTSSSEIKDKKEDKTSSSKAEDKSDSSSSEKKEPVDPSTFEISKEEKEQDGVHTETVTINVTSGMSSTDVAKLCQSAGLVDDYKKFDEFLCSNGYDRKITTGKKSIPVGASQVEVAGVLSVR